MAEAGAQAGANGPVADRGDVGVDRSVPAVIVKIGHYPLHHGGVGVLRSLGRAGVATYAVVEDRFTPAAASRYLSGPLVWPTTGLEDHGALVEGLMALGRRLPSRAVAVATDDEAAVLLAEHAGVLGECFVLPEVAPGLPRRLASKRGLHELCLEHGIPTPAASFPASMAEVTAFIARARFPVVVKSLEAWTRLRAPAVAHTTVVAGADALAELARGWPPAPSVMLQEYVPRACAEDWIFHGYFGSDSTPLVGFTGVKLRSWPAHVGVTTFARSLPNATVAAQSAELCRKIGYRGTADLDWRYDRRDGRYKLVDFNPRLGAQFRLFESHAGIDVVTALHLDLTGRPVPASGQVDGRGLIVENLDAAAVVAYRGGRGPGPPGGAGRIELAWAARDDPLPALVMAARFTGSGLSGLMRRAVDRRVSRRRGHPTAEDVPSGRRPQSAAAP